MLNRICLVGRTTKDIDLKKTPSGKSVATFSLACQRNIKNQNGEYDSDFFNCVAWGNTAEYMNQYIGKGYLISIDGRLQSRKYEDSNGKTVYVVEVIADSVCNLQPREATEKPAQKSEYSGFNTGASLDINSDDLPF